jgi:LL-H family phage holin
MREITLEALKLLIMVTVLVLTRFVVPWLKAKTSNETMQAVLDWTMQAVLAAEQAHQAQTGAERKYIVTEFIKNILIQKNISLSDEELNTLIEAAVMQMNANK